MAEGYSTDQDPGLSMSMEALAIQDKTQTDAVAMSHGLATLPTEMILQMAESLPPAYDTVQTGHAGSDTLHSAQAGISALQALCRVSKQMRAAARPNLYQPIVVSDPYKLHRLRETLEGEPELGEHVKSLAVYRDFDESDVRDIKDQRRLGENYVPEGITLSRFSETLVAVLKKTPNLVTLSLNLDKTTAFHDSRPFEHLKDCLQEDISGATDPNNPQPFLPSVVNLGILLPSGGASEIQRSEEYGIFKDLLNLPSLSHIVVRRPRLGSESSQGHEIYRELLLQREEPLRDTITSIDLRVDRRMTWEDIAEVTYFFPALSSLVLSHRSHERPSSQGGALWWGDGRIHMECLRHLSIDITVPDGWFKCQWFTDSIKSRFHFAPMLETLRIPMRLLRDPSGQNGAMLDPCDVLPGTLKSLVVIADLRVFRFEGAYGEDIAPVQEDYQDPEIPMPYAIARHMTVPCTIWFLEDIEALSPTYFPPLNMLGLEYKTNQVNHRGFRAVNQILKSSEDHLVGKMQDLQRTTAQKGIIHFSFTKLDTA